VRTNGFSIIVPFHSDLSRLGQCLEGLSGLPPGSEVIVVEDGAIENSRPLARKHGARVITVRQPGSSAGPAAARNAGAAVAIGEVFVFIDADVVVSPASLTRMGHIFVDKPETAAVFGSYDDRPADIGFMSQYKNLSHSFIHQSSATQALTFWAGFGAVRREAFCAVGGFDERFHRPSVEDIDLGYRLTQAGYDVLLDPALLACHLKHWTATSAIMSDIRDRGIPWTQLILRYGVLSNDLNLRKEYRLSIVLAYLALTSFVLGLSNRLILVGLPPLIVGITLLERRYYEFLCRKRGCWFAIRAWVMRLVHHWCNGLSLMTGTILFLGARYRGLQMPGALSLDAWGARRSRLSSAMHN